MKELATSFYFLRLLMDIRRNIDSKSYMDLRGYFFYFLRLATSLYSLMLLMDVKRNIDSTSYISQELLPSISLGF